MEYSPKDGWPLEVAQTIAVIDCALTSLGEHGVISEADSTELGERFQQMLTKKAMDIEQAEMNEAIRSGRAVYFGTVMLYYGIGMGIVGLLYYVVTK